MRYLVLLVLLLVTGYSATAQEARTRELGLRFTGLEDFDLIYKKSLTEDTYRRYRFFTGQLTFTNTDGVSIGNLNLGASIGKERRSSVADRVDFIRGPEFFLSLGGVATDDDVLVTIQPGFGYVLGLQYNVAERFYVGLESIPSVSILYGNGLTQIVALNAGFSSTFVALTAVYRFLPN